MIAEALPPRSLPQFYFIDQGKISFPLDDSVRVAWQYPIVAFSWRCPSSLKISKVACVFACPEEITRNLQHLLRGFAAFRIFPPLADHTCVSQEQEKYLNSVEESDDYRNDILNALQDPTFRGQATTQCRK